MARGPSRSHRWRGGNDSRHDPIQLVCCTYCNTSRPRYRFPKSALARYDKRSARAVDPSEIKIICFDCCNNPDANNNAGASGNLKDDVTEDSKAGTAGHGRAMTPRGQPERRGRCTACLVEYPLTIKFFTKADTKENAVDRRTCYSCKNNEIVRQAVDEAAEGGWELEAEEDVNFLPHDEQDDEEQLHTNFEDLEAQAQARAEVASRDFGNLMIKYINPLELGRRRRCLRFRPPTQLLLDAQLFAFREELHEMEVMGRDQWFRNRPLLTTLIDFDDLDNEEKELNPDVAVLTEFAMAVAETYRPSIPHRPSADGRGAGLGTIEASNDNDSDSDDDDVDDAMFRYSTGRLTERERLQRDREQRLLEQVEQGTAEELEMRSEAAKRLAQQEGDDLVNLLERRLIIDADRPRRAIPTFDTAFNFSTFDTFVQRTNALVQSSGSSQPAKKPRIRFETPVDPRRALLEARMREQEQRAPNQGGLQLKPELSWE